MKYTDKKEITETEKLQLIGLLVLAKAENEKLKDILMAVMAITGEQDDLGHSGEAVYGDYTADELLEKLGITVSSNKETSRCFLRKRPGQDWQPIIGTQFLRYLEDDDKVRLALGEIVAQDVGFGRVWLYRAFGALDDTE